MIEKYIMCDNYNIHVLYQKRWSIPRHLQEPELHVLQFIRVFHLNICTIVYHVSFRMNNINPSIEL